MKHKRWVLAILPILILTSCGQVEVESRWRTGAIVIDGRADDWQGVLYTVEGKGLALGVQNDGEFVYICLQASDRRMLAPVLRDGLIVWFDPAGGKDKVLGVKFPLGVDWSDFEGPLPGAQDRTGTRRNALADRDEVEILGPGRDEMIRFKREELKSIEVAVQNRGTFTYELKIPLIVGPDTPYAAAVLPGRTLGIGFNSPKPDLIRAGRGGGMAPGRGGSGGMGGRGGMGGMGGMGGGRRGGMRGGAEPLKIWLKANLAVPPVKE